MAKSDKWLTIDELAVHLKWVGTKLCGLAQRGGLPTWRIGNQWRSNRDNIDYRMKSCMSGIEGESWLGKSAHLG
jgi:excisionase family DNA binding protein